MKPWYVYILQCADDTLYAGVTTDPDRRLHEHNNTRAGAAYTRARRPVQKVFEAELASRSAALKAEYSIKQLTRSEKIDLIDGSSILREQILARE